MIVVDTNVLSEPLRSAPDPGVLAWLEDHSRELAITAISIAELTYGVERLPAGHRRTQLIAAVDRLVRGAGDRVLVFDASAATTYGSLRARREGAGLNISVEDTMIAAICLAGGHGLATRNTRDFADTDLVLHDPWHA